MRKLTFAQNRAIMTLSRSAILVWVFFAASFVQSWSQCTPQSNTISGTVFEDEENDGSFKVAESGLSNVLVTAYDALGNSVGSALSGSDGSYTITNLEDESSYRLEFQSTAGFYSSFIGEDSKSSVQFVDAPACEVDYGLTKEISSCGSNPDLILTCFVQGEVDDQGGFETLISVEHDFTASSAVSVLATMDETGAIWGVAHDVIDQNLFSAAFVKQYSGLKYGPYAILKTELEGPKKTSLHVDVNTLIDNELPGLSVSDVEDCAYGNQVGRIGLGNLIMSPDSRTLYTAVLDENLVVAIDTKNPTKSNTSVFQMPRPAGIDAEEEYKIFALEWHDGLIYVGGTVTGSFSQDRNLSMGVVMTLNPTTGTTSEIFRTNYIKGFWQDEKPESIAVSHWFTDISFNSLGEMMISFSDRIGHRYCKASSNRLDQQFPDLLMVAYNSATQKWELEQNGIIAGRTGSGSGNMEGPGGGEFFGFDHWPTNPTYHNETALGSTFVLPGSDEVVVAVYDPLVNSYSGGLQRYNIIDGSKSGAIELYSHTIFPVFGKATGFGDIVAKCSVQTIEIGNYVWNDLNGNGLQDADESGIPNLTINLYDDNCTLISSTTTDEGGNYAFNNSNVDSDQDGTFDGVYPNTTYFVELDNSLYDVSSGLYTIGNEEFTICTSNAGSNADDLIDCDAEYDPVGCIQGSFIEVNSTETNHTFDIALGVPSGFDLALRKEIIGNKFAKVGENLTFQITVFNQGGVSASEVTISDFIPTGYTFDELINPEWDAVSGTTGLTVSTKIKQKILPGKNVSRTLILKVSSAQAANYINVAEISEALSLAGDEATDEDSTPDAILDNDNGGEPFTNTDDQINDSGSIDEDDHDPAVPEIFDLAVRITLADDKFYYADDVVKFDVKLYNQGNVDADLVKLANYFPNELVFNEALNPDWKIEDDYIVMTDENILAAGETRDYCVFFNVAKFNTLPEILDHIEIIESSPVDHSGSFDFDSTPDNINTNDIGGTIYSSTDNQINDHGVVDEDDQDPVVIRTKYVDLALQKSADKRKVKAGEVVTFTIDVTNQGDAAASSFTLVDYLPEFMTLEDDNWTAETANLARRTVTLDDPLTKGQSTQVKIAVKIDDNITPRALVNFAEIESVRDAQGVEIGAKDIDSKPDASDNNDNGGVPDSNTDDTIDSVNAIDEDDHDPARIIVIDANLVGSECLENATNSSNGQYEDSYKVTSPSGDEWYVFDANNYYNSTSPDPADGALVPLATGPTALLAEMDMGDGMSMYTITVIRQDGEVGNIILRSNDDEVETFNMPAESYTTLSATGAQALCNGGTEEYCIVNPDPTVSYIWSTDAGAGVTITPTNATSSCVEINWDAAPVDANYLVSVEGEEGCIAPSNFNVSIGSSAGALSCLGNINLSLNGECEVLITPELVLTSEIGVGEAYSVMLTTPSGEVIPNATLTAAHVGMNITAKVIDACSGNSCWSNILVEDKMRPTIDCQDVTISCNKIDEFSGPFAQDNCGEPVTVTLLDESIEILSCDDYIAEISRSYQATDAQGNKSDVCSMSMFVERVDLADIIFPDNLLMMDNTALNCNAYDLDMDGVADLDITGRPLYNNEVVYPDFDQLCNTAITFEDEKRTIGGVIKITRTWTAWEWYCSDTETREHKQYIEIRDTEAPMITCPSDISVSAVTGNCEGTVVLQLPEVSDACSENLTVTIKPPFGPLIKEGDSRVVSFPLVGSPYPVVYTATDDTGNSSTCEIMVTVTDNIAPVAICDQNTIVGLNSVGVGYAYALNIDDGSYDACGLEKLEIRRMDVGGAYSDKVLFDCDDVGNDVVVELRATDVGGLTNTCMANVIVQDKHAPVITGPANVTIDCDVEYLPLSQWGDFTFTDACEVTTTSDSIVSISSCQTGTITRVFIAADKDGADTAYQVITIENSDPFSEDDIISYPRDTMIVINSCDASNLTDPENLPAGYNYPVFNDGPCDMVAAGFHDTKFDLINDPNSICFKIRRTWTIVDWCQKDINGNPIEFADHIQTISVINEVEPDPIVITIANDTIVTADCDEGLVEFTANSGDCNPNTLISLIQLDLNADFNTTGVYEDTITSAGSEINFSETLPVGNHNIVVTFMNPCGNSVTTLFPIVITNNIAPVILCNATVVTLGPWDLDGDGTPDTEAACIDVNSLINPSGTTHPCGDDFDVSFSLDSIQTKLCFDCNNQGIQDVTVYAISENGASSSCNTTVTVLDGPTVDICMDVKDCISEVADTMLFLSTECTFTVNNTSLDVMMTSSDPLCADLTITHDQSGPSNTTLNGVSFPLGATTVTWTISNGLMTESCETVITVKDEIDPTINCADDATFNTSTFTGCTYNNVGTALDPTVSDNCTIVSTVHDYAAAPSSTTLDGATFPVGTYTVTFTTTDDSGNTASCELDITVSDNVAPQLTCAASTSFPDTFDGNTGCSHTVTGTILDPVVNTDDCSTIMSLTHDYADAPSNTTLDNAEFDLGSTTVIFTATDDAGNSSTCEVTVIVTDNVDPSITCPSDLFVQEREDGTVDCNYLHQNTTLDASIVIENCEDEGFTITHDYASAPSNSTLNGASFPIGTTTVIWTVTDAAGNTGTCDLDIAVIDDVAPICVAQPTIDITIGGDQVVILDESLLPNAYSDACGIASYSFSPATLDCDPVGIVDVELTVTDVNGNSSVCDLEFNVMADLDVSCSLNIDTVFLNINGMASIVAADVVDIVGGGCGIDYVPTINQSTFGCEDTGVVTITISANDEVCGTDQLVVVDQIDPVVSCVTDVTFNDTDDLVNDCQHTIGDSSLDPSVVEACVPITFTHNYTSAPSASTLEGAVFPLGTVTITWTAMDVNGNTSTCIYNVTVIDNVAPTCTDQPIIDITVNAGDVIVITDDLIPNAYTDNCSIASITYDPVSIDCEDGGSLDVTATVTDGSGNSIECPIEFNVIVNEDLSCSFNIDTVYLDEDGQFNLLVDDIVTVTGGICGDDPALLISRTFVGCNDVSQSPVSISIFANGMLCGTDELVVLDTIAPSATCSPISITCTEFETTHGGDVAAFLATVSTEDYFADNCVTLLQTSITDDITALNECNYGVIARTVIAMDTLSGMSDTCIQEITIEGPANPLTQAEVDAILVDTVVITDCAGGTPMITEIENADLIALVDCGVFTIDFADVSAGTGCPDTITRTYTIDATCQDLTITSTQIIIINDDINPVVATIADSTIVANPITCSAAIDLSGITTATDNCTNADDLTLTYAYDGTGDVPIDMVSIIENGTYNVTVTATDGCGNMGIEEFELMVVDTSDVTVTCNKIIVYIDPADDMVDVDTDEAFSVFGNCNEDLNIIASWDENDLSDTIRTYDCDQLDEPAVPLMFVWEVTPAGDTIPFDISPNAAGIQNDCKIEVEVRDTSMACSTTIFGISGTVSTPSGVGIPDYKMTLHGSNSAPILSDEGGSYAFLDMPLGGNYTIGTYNNNDVMNGVTTLDLILIQRHMLGMFEFDSPYKYIAADVNNSESLTASDLLLLRKMILGVYTEFPNNNSWRSVDSEFEFDDVNDPWSSPISDAYNIMGLSNNMYIDFVGIKIGDVNGSVAAGFTQESISTRSQLTKSLTLEADNGQAIISAQEAVNVAGLQFSISTRDLNITDISSNVFDQNQIGFYEVADGLYNISIASANAEAFEEGNDLFTIEFDCSDCDMNSIQQTTKNLSSEIYLNADLEAAALIIERDENNYQNTRFSVTQNTPNPWSGYTEINVNMPSEGDVTIKILDVTGRTIYSGTKSLNSGANILAISDTEVSGSGVFFYEISTDTQSAQYKMIKLK